MHLQLLRISYILSLTHISIQSSFCSLVCVICVLQKDWNPTELIFTTSNFRWHSARKDKDTFNTVKSRYVVS